MNVESLNVLSRKPIFHMNFIGTSKKYINMLSIALHLATYPCFNPYARILIDFHFSARKKERKGITIKRTMR